MYVESNDKLDWTVTVLVLFACLVLPWSRNNSSSGAAHSSICGIKWYTFYMWNQVVHFFCLAYLLYLALVLQQQ